MERATFKSIVNSEKHYKLSLVDFPIETDIKVVEQRLEELKKAGYEDLQIEKDEQRALICIVQES
jgi:hypothetical protein